MLGRCDSSQQWLGPATAPDERCTESSRLLIRTASNAYFPQKLSVISMPDRGQALHAAVGRIWDSHLQVVHDRAMLTQSSRESPKWRRLWPASTTRRLWKRSSPGRAGQDGPPQRKIKVAEFELLSCGQPTIGKNEHDSVFYAEDYPKDQWKTDLTKDLERVVIVHRLREVTALVGYTRFDYISPDIDGEFDLNLRPGETGHQHKLGPCHREQGRGPVSPVQQGRDGSMEAAIRRRRAGRRNSSEVWNSGAWNRTFKVEFSSVPLTSCFTRSRICCINAISLECGYPASSIKERIYANEDQGYGILLYTACADSMGTLGGLANAAKSIGHYLKAALEMGQLCSNDPICAQHDAGDANERRYLQGAACHGCLLISETSCELFNDFLDRSFVVPTVACLGAEFFPMP